MKRRDFLKNLALTTGASFLPMPLLIKRAHAAANHKLVVIFQRGGNDGINTVIPYGDPDYTFVRPNINLPVPPANLADGTPDVATSVADWRTIALPDSNYFGLHPGMEPLYKYYTQGRLALLPTVGYPNSSQSHFIAQDHIEGAAETNGEDVYYPQDGWLYRYLGLTDSGSDHALRALGLDSRTVFSLKGANYNVSTANNVDRYSLQDILGTNFDSQLEHDILQDLEDMYSANATVNTPNQLLTHRFGNKAIQDQEALIAMGYSAPVPQNGASYSNITMATQLKQAAHLFRLDPNVQVCAVSTAGMGWDTHKSQLSHEKDRNHSRSLQLMSSTIDQFYTDLGYNTPGAEPSFDTTILVCTEFGRTITENNDQGTDHGKAACWFLLGNRINGGLYTTEVAGDGFADWPGLVRSESDRQKVLNQQHIYLPHTTDYRDIYGDVLSQVFGLDTTGIGSVLPGYQATYSSLNLFETTA